MAISAASKSKARRSHRYLRRYPRKMREAVIGTTIACLRLRAGADEIPRRASHEMTALSPLQRAHLPPTSTRN